MGCLRKRPELPRSGRVDVGRAAGREAHQLVPEACPENPVLAQMALQRGAPRPKRR